MYDRAETAHANNAFWAAIRARLGYGPSGLTRNRDLAEIWRDPDLLLSQTCGMPFRTGLHRDVTLVGTPDYGLSGCPPGYYNSVFVVHINNKAAQLSDLEGKTLAYNDPGSHSGWAAPMTHAHRENISFGRNIATGSHQNSARAVAEGNADIAAIDALTWHMIKNYDGFAKNLRVLTTTPPTPTLPFITAKSRDPAPLFTAIKCAIGDLSQNSRDILRLKTLVAIPRQTYLDVATPAAPKY